MHELSEAAIQSASSRAFVHRRGLERWLAAHGVSDPAAACCQCADSSSAAPPEAFGISNCVGSTASEQQTAAKTAGSRQLEWRPDRARAAVVAALVADAASQTSHWRYDTEAFWAQMQREGSWDSPEFVWPSLNSSYALDKGEFSCYGDQMMVVLQSLVASGDVDVDDLIARTVAAFDEDTSYGALYEPLERPKEPRPWTGGWRHNSLHEFIKRVREGVGFPACGASDPRNCGGDSQVDCLVRIIPVVALYAGTEQMMQKVRQVVRVTQSNDKAIMYAEAGARLLELCICGVLPGAAVLGLQAELSHRQELADLTAQLKLANRKERSVLRDRMFDLEKSDSIEVSWKLGEVISRHTTAVSGVPFHVLAVQAGSGWQSGGIA